MKYYMLAYAANISLWIHNKTAIALHNNNNRPIRALKNILHVGNI